MQELIVVGCGEHFQKNLGPSLSSLEGSGDAKVIATVDVGPLSGTPAFLKSPVPHLVRKPGAPLSPLLRRFEASDPVIMLAHSHDLHAADALELVSGGFRVILEKPYALRVADLSLIEECVRSKPRRLALAEYYLMMKAAPLLHAAGLLQPNSFYLSETGYLERVGGEPSSLEALVGSLALIGRPRMICADVLEGEGRTGRFEHRGRQFADARIGIGVILDLAIHALAPIVALESALGALPAAADASVATGVCDAFLRFAQANYGVPPEFVPETYAELRFSTSIGIPVIIAVGKYVIRGENQRRLLVVGDEGEALLDMSDCTLSIGRRDKCPATVLRAPKQADTKYRAVIRACLQSLTDGGPYTFSASEVALRSNAFTLSLHERACEQGAGRPSYAEGAVPADILQRTSHLPTDSPNGDVYQKGAALYYEHQYERLAAVEDQGFKMSSGVLVLTAAVFTFASRVGTESFLPPWVAVALMGMANFAAVIYMIRVRETITGHQRRAKAVLGRAWPAIWKLDASLRIKGDKFQIRSLILMSLHMMVVLAAILMLIGVLPGTRPRNQPLAAPGTQQPSQQATMPPPALGQRPMSQPASPNAPTPSPQQHTGQTP